MMIIGVEIKDAIRVKGRIVWNNPYRREKGPRSDKHPVFRVKNRSLRTLMWLYGLFREEGVVPSAMDFSLLTEVISKKIGITRYGAYDYARALSYITS